MGAIINFFIHRPKVVNLILVFVLLAGVLSMIRTQNQGYPDVDFGYVSITTFYPGASPEDVELLVTNKLEDELEGIGGIEAMHSASMENMSLVTLQIEEDAEYEEVVDDIGKAVDLVTDFPDAVTDRPIVTEVNNDRIPVVEVSLSGDVSYETLRQYATSLENILRNNDNIGVVDKVGFLDPEVKIEAHPQKLSTHYVSLGELYSAISASNFRQAAGDLKSPLAEKKLLVMSEFEDLLDVKDVIVRSGFDGNRVLVSDIANVFLDYESADTITHYNGQLSINLLAKKKETADIVVTATDVKALVETFKETVPDNLNVEVIVDYSVEVNDLLNLVISNAKVGLVFVLLFLVLFLNFHVALWTAVGIPFSILGAFIFLPTFDLSINFITLMGIIIVLGMVVDDAILVAENIYSYREKGLPGREAAIKGAKEVIWPVTTSVLTTIVAFSPMLVMTGVMGKFMYPMPIIISLILLASLFESLFILPSHIAHAKMPSKPTEKRFRPFKALEVHYQRLVSWTLHNRLKTYLIFSLVALSAIVLLGTKMKFQLFPSDDSLFGVITYELPRGYSLADNAQKIQEVEDILLSFPKEEIDGFVTGVGEPTPPILSYGNIVNASFVGSITIYLTPMGSRDRTAEEIINELKEALSPLEGFTKLEAEIMQDGPPVGKAVTITFVSENDTLRLDFAERLKMFLSEQEGVFNIQDNEGEGKKRLDISLHYDQISRLGLAPNQVSETIRMAYDGLVATSLQRRGEEIDYRVQLDLTSRKEISYIEKLTVQNNAGKLIPIGQLIEIVEKDDVQVYNHEDGERSITIYSDVDSDLITSGEVNKLILNTFQPLVDQNPEIRLVVGGEEKDTQESMQSLFFALMLALIGIYFILVILFNSYTQPFLVMMAIPFSFVGVTFAFFAHQMPFSFPALIGMVGLMGVVVNNSLVMISFLNTATRSGGLSIPIIVEAASRRLRPIFLTSLTTAAGLLPTAYGYLFGFGSYNPVIIPMIRAIAWGLIFSTVITLILIPALFMTHKRLGGLCKNLFHQP